MNDETIFPFHAHKKKPSFGFLFGAKKPLEWYIILICATSPTVIANFISCSYPMTCVTPPARLLPPEYRP